MWTNESSMNIFQTRWRSQPMLHHIMVDIMMVHFIAKTRKQVINITVRLTNRIQNHKIITLNQSILSSITASNTSTICSTHRTSQLLLTSKQSMTTAAAQNKFTRVAAPHRSIMRLLPMAKATRCKMHHLSVKDK